jgi:hypothetical protein
VKAIGNNCVKGEQEDEGSMTKIKKLWVNMVCLEIKKMVDKLLVILKKGEDLKKETLHDWCVKVAMKLSGTDRMEIVPHLRDCLWKKSTKLCCI